MTVLSAPAFGGGVVLEGSADAQRTDELAACQSYDIGARGQLVVTSDLSDYFKTTAGLSGAAMTPIYGMIAVAHPQAPLLVFIGLGSDLHQKYATLLVGAPVDVGGSVNVALDTPAAGLVATFASFPYVDAAGKQRRVVLLNFGARSFQDPSSLSGLYALVYDPTGPSYTVDPISKYDALGTGALGEFLGGNKGKQLTPRGVVAYNNHAFLWGLDHYDAAGDGPNRLMFSALGNPLKYGNDPDAQGILDGTVAESNRDFEDSDAVTVGGSGESIRCCYPWRGKLWIGTNRELHYLEGFGRESFITNGSLSVARSRNTIGPHAMIEGPDALLYGVSDEGLWKTNGGAVDALGDRLRDFEGFSRHWWDLIWSDPSRTLLTFPGRTNQDLVWMRADEQAKQVWVVIPYCNAALGYGYGTDTVIIKYHTQTGGFTRQVFVGKTLLAGSDLTREGVAPAQTFVCDSADAAFNVRRFAYKATQATAPVLPTSLPDVTFGPYAPFGPDGVGVMRRKYLTLAWASAALPLVFTVTLTVDGQAMTPVTLTIGAVEPVAPANGDCWLDTSGTDTNLGNGTAGTIIPANAADYLLRRYVSSWGKWVLFPGSGGQGTRASLPIAFTPARGSRFTIRVVCTAAAGRFQVEQMGDKPTLIREGA